MNVKNSGFDSFDTGPMCSSCYIPFLLVRNFILDVRIELDLYCCLEIHNGGRNNMGICKYCMFKAVYEN